MVKDIGPIYDMVPREFVAEGQLQHSSFVFFERTDEIHRMSLIPEIELGGNVYPVKWIKTHHRWNKFCMPPPSVGEKLLTPPNAESLERMLDLLNNDCLYAILMQAPIGIDELLNIAQTCDRLEVVAKMAFRSKYRDQIYRVQIPDYWTLQKIEAFFRIFGDCCKQFWLLTRPFKVTSAVILWEIIAKYCTAVVDIKISGGTLPEAMKFRSIFSKLEVLRMETSTIDLTKIFDTNKNVKVLELHECEITLPSKTFPELKELVLKQCSNRGSSNSVKRFFQRNPQLVQLDMTLNKFERTFRITDAIKHLVNLEKLTWVWDDEVKIADSLLEVHHFGNLTKLTNLIIRDHADAQNCLLTANVLKESVKVQLVPFYSTMNPYFQMRIRRALRI